MAQGWEVAARINALSRGKKSNTAGREAGAVITDSGQLRAGAPIALPGPYRSRLFKRAGG